MDAHEIRVDTSNRRFVDLTEELHQFCSDKGDGLCHVFTPHATAGLALMETGSGSESDLSQLIDALLPRDDRYGHAHGARGHGADHLLPAIIAPFLVIAVEGGMPVLGTWQSVVLVDTNRDNPSRRVLFHFLAD